MSDDDYFVFLIPEENRHDVVVEMEHGEHFITNTIQNDKEEWYTTKYKREFSPIPEGPNLAPTRNVAPVSNGIPATKKSTLLRLVVCGKRIKVRIPSNRGYSIASKGVCFLFMFYFKINFLPKKETISIWEIMPIIKRIHHGKPNPAGIVQRKRAASPADIAYGICVQT